MEVSLENLIKAMKLCAKAHNVEFADWSEDGQLGIRSETIPVHADVQAIADAFFTDAEVSSEYGYTTLWLGCEERAEVDIDTLAMALPYGWVEQI